MKAVKARKQDVIAMWLAVRGLKEQIEREGTKAGLSFDQMERILSDKMGKNDGIVNRLVNWVTGN